MRGQGETAASDDLVVEQQRKKRLHPFERYLRKFEYRNAVDAAIKTNRPLVIVSLLLELAHRQALPAALSGMDDVQLLVSYYFYSKTSHIFILKKEKKTKTKTIFTWLFFFLVISLFCNF